MVNSKNCIETENTIHPSRIQKEIILATKNYYKDLHEDKYEAIKILIAQYCGLDISYVEDKTYFGFLVDILFLVVKEYEIKYMMKNLFKDGETYDVKKCINEIISAINLVDVYADDKILIDLNLEK